MLGSADIDVEHTLVALSSSVTVYLDLIFPRFSDRDGTFFMVPVSACNTGYLCFPDPVAGPEVEASQLGDEVAEFVPVVF